MKYAHVASRGAVVILLLIGLLALPAPAAAEVSVEGSTSYDGLDDSSQAITVTVTLSPDGSRITDATLTVGPTSQTFLDEQSFETTITPGNADVDVSYQGNGQFDIGELNPDETVEITYQVYPRTIKEEEIDATQVSVDYVQNGQNLETQETYAADMTSSAFFEYETLKQQQQSESLFGSIGLFVSGGLALLVLVFGAAVVLMRDSDDGGARPPGPP